MRYQRPHTFKNLLRFPNAGEGARAETRFNAQEIQVTERYIQCRRSAAGFVVWIGTQIKQVVERGVSRPHCSVVQELCEIVALRIRLQLLQDVNALWAACFCESRRVALQILRPVFP